MLEYHTHEPAAIPCPKLMRITVVHQSPRGGQDRALDTQRPSRPPNAEMLAHPSPFAGYVLVPDALITTFAHDPLAVGVYIAIARLTRVAKDAVPVAARDLAAWMGSQREADRAALMRRIVKLEHQGWLMITRTTARKHTLLPTWGRSQAGCPRPWQFATPAY